MKTQKFSKFLRLSIAEFLEVESKAFFYSNVSTDNITLCRGQQYFFGNALRHINTQLLKMSFIHHASPLIRRIFPPAS